MPPPPNNIYTVGNTQQWDSHNLNHDKAMGYPHTSMKILAEPRPTTRLPTRTHIKGGQSNKSGNDILLIILINALQKRLFEEVIWPKRSSTVTIFACATLLSQLAKKMFCKNYHPRSKIRTSSFFRNN